jgi:hypothetical protein
MQFDELAQGRHALPGPPELIEWRPDSEANDWQSFRHAAFFLYESARSDRFGNPNH